MNEQVKELWSKAAEQTKSDSLDEQVKFIDRFATLIAAAEREANAVLAEEFYLQEKSALAVAAAIRARENI